MIPQDAKLRSREVGRPERRGTRRRTLTDLGNAERFRDMHGENVRFCHQWQKWLVYDGRRWVVDDAGLVAAMMKQTVRRIYAEAERVPDEELRKATASHAKRSESRARIMDALILARSEPGIPVVPSQLDADPWLLNVQNGTVDLRTGELRKHRREDLIMKMAPVEYDPNANAPEFEKMLKHILPSEALRRFVKRAFGYSACGVVSEEVLVILHGLGRNGKTTLVNAVMETLGDYAKQGAPDLLLSKRGSHPTELADLFRARFVAATEVDEGRRLNEALVKQLTGRDVITARRMREDFWSFFPTHTLFLSTNHRPVVKGTDHAIWRRPKLVPFDVTISKREEDKQLPEKLRIELPGILHWIIQGCLEWQREGLSEPDEVMDATEKYRQEMDILQGFIDDCCVVQENASVGATPLYHAYQRWCAENGEEDKGQTEFGRALGERGFKPDRDTKTRRKEWHGIGLFTEETPPGGGGGGGAQEGGEVSAYAEGGDMTQTAQAKQSKQFETDFAYSSPAKQKISVNDEIGLRTVSEGQNRFGNGGAGVTSDGGGGSFVTNNDIPPTQRGCEQRSAKRTHVVVGRNPSDAAGPAAGPNERLWRSRQGDFAAECKHGTPGGCWLCKKED